ncbi:MAG: hypothetical protein IT332_01775 [Ardenticatenales bacterium]|nr:hypothetical protein [Ardenticatenales bacterium]
MNQNEVDIIAESQRPYYNAAMEQVMATIRHISDERARVYGLSPWTLSSRLKDANSIVEKIGRKRSIREDYSLDNITDIAGVRVIVESDRTARSLESFIRSRNVFSVNSEASESFLDAPRSDGYRGIHLILLVDVRLASAKSVPVEVQIRTMLHHQWSELSHSEFYKSVEDIPGSLLLRMRSLSEALHLAEIESAQLRRSRILDECQLLIWDELRERVLETLSAASSDSSTTRAVGQLGILLLNTDRQLRRILVSDGEAQRLAFRTFIELADRISELCEASNDAIDYIVRRLTIYVQGIPDDW